MPVIARHSTLQLVVFQQDDELRICHAGCFNKPLVSSVSVPGWWFCQLCRNEVKERTVLDTEYGEWPGPEIRIPKSGLSKERLRNWVAVWLDADPEDVEVSIEWER